MPACGAILDLPDPRVDDGFGSGDASSPDANDSQILIDGELPDGFVPPKDGSPGSDGSLPPVDSGHNICNGIDCLGGDCVDNQCQAFPFFMMSELDPTVIATDGTSLFFKSTTANIDRLNLSTKALDQLVGPEDGINQIAVSGSSFYFTRTATNHGELSSCPTDGVAMACGSGTGRVDYFKDSTNAFYGVAVIGTKVYFTFDQTGAMKGLESCALGTPACTPSSLDTIAQAHKLIAIGTELLWDDDTVSQNGIFEYNTGTSIPGSSNETNVIDIGGNSTQLVYTTTGTVSYRTPAQTLGTDIAQVSGASNVAVGADDTYVYWLDHANGGVFERCSLADNCTTSPASIQVLATGLNDPRDFVLTGNSAYITTLDKIYRVVVK